MSGMTETTTLRAWAIPLGFRVFDREIGDHTWVTGDDRFCEGCRFGVVPSPDSFYCGDDRWATGRYVPPPSPPSRQLGQTSGTSKKAKCLAGSAYRFMGIPSQSGVIYIVNGVCHTLSNRILYGTGLTVRGALGADFTELVYGVYGTMVPLAYIPPVLLIPWPPFIIPNPLYAVALAVLAGVNIEWNQIRSNCGVSLGDEAPAYLREIAALHERPLAAARQNEWTGDAMFALQQESRARHAEEMRINVQSRGTGIDEGKLDAVVTLFDRLHAPNRSELDAHFAAAGALRLDALSEPEITEPIALAIAATVNDRAAATAREAAQILGARDFETLFGHSPERPFLLAEPDILKAAATRR